jgi:DNA polymerase-3 subunit epsilon
MREIVFDTETTGMDPADGHKLVEIGCVELQNLIPTGRTFHVYINPERDVPADAVAVHGLDNARLENEPTFGEVVGAFIDFIGTDSKLVAHNAEFDVKFLNAELKTFGFPSLEPKRIIDTLKIARGKFPGSPANLDALCRRFAIDNSNRTLHGALLDSELLAEVYLELLGGRQQTMMVEDRNDKENAQQSENVTTVKREIRKPRNFPLKPEEEAAHAQMRDQLKDALWQAS